MMSLKWLIIFICIVNLSPIFAQYEGGNGDGFTTDIALKNLMEGNAIAIYYGGDGDGFAKDISLKNLMEGLAVTIYFGGDGDGFTQDMSLKNLMEGNAVAIYYGGDGDGFTQDMSFKNLMEGNAIAIYFGGDGDGFAQDMSLKNLMEGNAIAIYFGGDGDGFAKDISLKNLMEGNAVAIYYGGDGDGFSSSQKTLQIIEQIRANIIVFLQGPLLLPSTPGLMNDILREDNYLPTTSPYIDAITISPAILNTTGTDAIVDWVWLELRSDTDFGNVIKSRSALLQRDGDIVDLNGVSNISIEVPSKDYYIVIKHRNHLGVMSANPIALSSTPNTVDFTDSSFLTFGNNAQVVLNSGETALWAGNVNGDTFIQYAGAGVLDTSSLLAFILNDGSNFLNLPTWSVTGYTNNDVDMNGTTQYAGAGVLDTPYILQNILSYPGNFLNLSTWQIQEQLPEN